MNKPNYENYTLDELYDAYNHINKNNYPERVLIIESEIRKRKAQARSSSKSDKNEHEETNSIIDNSEISSSVTIIYKFIFPTVWILGFGAGTIFAILSKNEIGWMLLVPWIMGSFFILLYSYTIKKVRIDVPSRVLKVSNYFKTVDFSFSEIASIRNDRFTKPETVSIKLKDETIIKFIPRLSPRMFKFTFFKEHPVVKDLKEIIDQTPYNTGFKASLQQDDEYGWARISKL